MSVDEQNMLEMVLKDIKENEDLREVLDSYLNEELATDELLDIICKHIRNKYGD